MLHQRVRIDIERQFVEDLLRFFFQFFCLNQPK
jgi:hypothetical protein